MVRPVLFVFAALLAGCTAPAYTCGHPVPCARGSVQSCTSRDGARCRYKLSDDTVVECAACDDCFVAEREVAAWCAGVDSVGAGENGGSLDLGSDDPGDMSVGGTVGEPPPDLALPMRDLATPRGDLAMTPATDMSLGDVDSDLGCFAFGYRCDLTDDPNCCSSCCAGGCNQVGSCALF